MALPSVDHRVVAVSNRPQGGKIDSLPFGQGASFSTFTELTGMGSESGVYYIQDFTFDPILRKMYALTLNGSGSGELSTISEFNLDVPKKLFTETAHTTPASNVVGHQGLGFEALVGSDFRLWTTAYRDSPSIYTGRHAVRYKFTSGGAITNTQVYLLFGSDFVDSTSCTPSVSVCGRYLVAHGTKTGGDASNTRIRIFDLPALRTGGPGDYSNAWLMEIPTQGLVDSSFPLQGLACDGSIISAISGGNALASKRLYHYDMRTGDLLFADNEFRVGYANAAADGAGTRYEPEGLEYLKDGSDFVLVVGIMSGDVSYADRKYRYYIADKPLERFYRGIAVPYNSTGGSADGNVKSGTYTPTVAGATNIASVGTVDLAWWTRVGDVVTVSGKVTVTPTASGLTEFNISVPVASNFANKTQASGSCRTDQSTTQQAGVIYSEATSDGVQVRYVASAAAAHAFWYSFTYMVI